MFLVEEEGTASSLRRVRGVVASDSGLIRVSSFHRAHRFAQHLQQ
jgi:hypothetical protein